MLPTGDQIGFVTYGSYKPTKRRTCKMILDKIRQILMVTICGFREMNFMDELTKSIVHESFIKAIDQLEQRGYLSLNQLETIVRVEYRKANGDPETGMICYCDIWFNDFT